MPLTLMVVAFAVCILLGWRVSGSELRADQVRRLLLWALGGVLLLRLSLEGVARNSGNVGPMVVVAQLVAVGLFGVLAVLALSGPYRKNARNGHFFFTGLAFVVLLQGEAVGAAGMFTIGMLRHPWLRSLRTGERFTASVLAILAVTALMFGPLDLEALQGVHGGAFVAVRTVRNFAAAYAFFTILRAFKAFTDDPTLGIRRVSLRLTLSHVLVLTVPLLIVVALWVSSTYLGVNAERAIIAGRQVSDEAQRLEQAIGEAWTASGDPVTAARTVGSGRERRWPGTRTFLVREGAVTRTGGEPVGNEAALAEWFARRDSLPRLGVIELGGVRWLGAMHARGSEAVAVLAPVSVVLDSSVSVLAGAKLDIAPPRGETAIDSLAAGVKALRDSLAALDEEIAPGDSAAMLKARELARSFGLPESSVTTSRRGRPLVVRTAGDTTSGSNVGLTGQIEVHGLAYRKGAWNEADYNMRVRASWRSTLTGLFEQAKENPLQVIPIAVLVGLGLLLLPLFQTNMRMVRGMGGSITQAIRALRDGARAFGDGKLTHRIPISGDDDLWDTARQFNQMADGLERARELEKERDRLENELDVARRIQARLLPAGSPDVPGFDVAGRSESAREVGGDYYDHLDLGNGRWLFVVADVSDKGVPAALLMSGFRAALMSQDETRVEPERVASRINDFLHRSVEPGRFVTAFFGFLESASGRFVYVNAGHNPPLLRRADGKSEWLSEGGLILGIMSGSVFASGETTLEPGDVLTLYTDGVTEGADATGEQWGEDRLVAEIHASHALPAREIAGRLVTTVRGFEGATGPADDLTVLVVKRRPLA